MSIIISREMTITHADFFRILPNAVRGHEYTVSGNQVQVKLENDSRIIMSLSEETRRQIGAFSLPVTRLEIRFDGMTEQSVRDFLTGFDRTYQKGGG